MKTVLFSFLLLGSIVVGGVSAMQDSAPSLEPVEALPEHLVYLYSSDTNSIPGDAKSQLFANARRWESGRTLKVCLFGGNPVVAALIRQAAGEWSQYSSLKLDFGPPQRGYNCVDPRGGYYEIRVGFRERGYWSTVGTDSETRVDALAPSMNLEGFGVRYSSPRFTVANVFAAADRYHIATIRHEFGHALALLHEHQNPALGCQDEIKWDGPGNVFEYFAGAPNYWTPDLVTRNLGFIGNTDPDYQAGEADPKSIMMYALPPEVFRRGAGSPCRVERNFDISPKDRRVIGHIYPSAPALTRAIDTDLAGAKVRAMAAVPAPDEARDATERILTDLESDDVYVRRNARARLAELLAKLPSADATALVVKSGGGSYRVQLGVAVAVGSAPQELVLTKEAKSVLMGNARNAKDASLKGALGKASQR